MHVCHFQLLLTIQRYTVYRSIAEEIRNFQPTTNPMSFPAAAPAFEPSGTQYEGFTSDADMLNVDDRPVTNPSSFNASAAGGTEHSPPPPLFWRPHRSFAARGALGPYRNIRGHGKQQ